MGRGKIKGLQRVHFMVDPETLTNLEWLAALDHEGNRSRTVRVIVAQAVEARLREGSPKKKRSSRR